MNSPNEEKGVTQMGVSLKWGFCHWNGGVVAEMGVSSLKWGCRWNGFYGVKPRQKLWYVFNRRCLRNTRNYKEKERGTTPVSQCRLKRQPGPRQGLSSGTESLRGNRRDWSQPGLQGPRGRPQSSTDALILNETPQWSSHLILALDLLSIPMTMRYGATLGKQNQREMGSLRGKARLGRSDPKERLGRLTFSQGEDGVGNPALLRAEWAEENEPGK